MSRLRKTAVVISATVILLAAAVFMLPWKTWIEQKLIAEMAAKGVTPASLIVDSIGYEGLHIRDVSLGDPPLKLDTVMIRYDLKSLRDGKVSNAVIEGLSLSISKNEVGEWVFEGLDPLLRKDKKPTGDSAVPLTSTALTAIPVQQITLSRGRAGISMQGFYADIPLMLTLDTANATLAGQSENLSVAVGGDTLRSKELSVNLALDTSKQECRGEWTAKDFTLTSERITLPELQAKGTITITSKVFTLTGSISSHVSTHHAAFTLSYPLVGDAAPVLNIAKAQLPWGEGHIGVNALAIPLSGKKATTLNLQVENVAIASLLKAMTNDATTATGTVSGSIPLTIQPDGTIAVGKGMLRAAEPGVISLAPDTIPGDNPQVALVREVMKNLQYSVLALELDMTPQRMLVAKLAVEGKNPDVEKGRPIKLNVQLSGDLLNLILQNMKLMTDPKTFIEQSPHEPTP